MTDDWFAKIGGGGVEDGSISRRRSIACAAASTDDESRILPRDETECTASCVTVADVWQWARVRIRPESRPRHSSTYERERNNSTSNPRARGVRWVLSRRIRRRGEKYRLNGSLDGETNKISEKLQNSLVLAREIWPKFNVQSFCFNKGDIYPALLASRLKSYSFMR